MLSFSRASGCQAPTNSFSLINQPKNVIASRHSSKLNIWRSGNIIGKELSANRSNVLCWLKLQMKVSLRCSTTEHLKRDSSKNRWDENRDLALLKANWLLL